QRASRMRWPIRTAVDGTSRVGPRCSAGHTPDRSAHPYSSLHASRRTRWAVMSDLVSKVLAGGLSAARCLVWWPAHLPGDGPEWLGVRGVLWTLAFEILLVSFCPLERAI